MTAENVAEPVVAYLFVFHREVLDIEPVADAASITPGTPA